jgi:hypothetical protein
MLRILSRIYYLVGMSNFNTQLHCYAFHHSDVTTKNSLHLSSIFIKKTQKRNGRLVELGGNNIWHLKPKVLQRVF